MKPKTLIVMAIALVLAACQLEPDSTLLTKETLGESATPNLPESAVLSSPTQSSTPIPKLLRTPTLPKTAALFPTIALTYTPSPTATSIHAPIPQGGAVLFLHDHLLWLTDSQGTEPKILEGVDPLGDQTPGVEYLRSVECFYGNTHCNGFQFSPDGRWVVIPDGNTFVLVDLQKPSSSPLPRNQVSWSPDSRQLVYIVYDPHVITVGSRDDPKVMVYDVYHRTETCLFSAESLVDSTWSPDGRYIAVGAHATAGGDVWLIDVISDHIRKVGFSHSGMTRRLLWSADGQRLAMLRENPNSHRIEWAVLSLKDESIEYEPYSLLSDPDWLPNPMWKNQNSSSHSGCSLARVVPSTRGEQQEWWKAPSLLSVIDTCAGQTVYESQIAGRVPIVRWSPDDKWVFFSVLNVQDCPCEYPELGPCCVHSSIWRLAADGTGETNMIVEEGFLLGILSD